jgi:acetylornithine deacetylase/succinyl-diaminopimelate desuccinylase-like protein
MSQVLKEVLRWIQEWQEQARWAGRPGFVNLGCMQAGHPWRASRTPERADLFLDVRVPPTMSMTDARRAAKKLFLDMKKKYPEYGLEFDTYVSVPGASIDENHEMVQAIERNHRGVVGSAPERDTVLWCSDASTLSRHGVPTVNYGPSSGPRDEQGEKVAIKTLVDITKIYALTAAELCGAHG